MNPRAMLGCSLAANLGLALAWLVTVNLKSRGPASAPPSATEAMAAPVKTNLLIRRQFFSWQELESADYPTYIKNLREIGCPEQTVRDIIIADVNLLFAQRRAAEIATPDQQWWRAQPDEDMAKLAETKAQELDAERRNLLTQLLGLSWEGGDLVGLPRPSRPALPLDGPVLGPLPLEVKQTVQELNLRAQERVAAYLESRRAAGLAAEPSVLAALRQQARAELAQVLTASQMEEYLLRFSPAAAALRTEFGQLKLFNPTAEEFRAVFRAVEPYDLQLQLLADATDGLSASARQALKEQRLAALRNVLGPDRFAQYQKLHDEHYQEAYASALRAGVPEAAGPLYEINRAVQEEQARLRAQTNLTPAQLAIELKRVELETLKGAAQALGQELPPEPETVPKPEPKKVHVLKSGEGLNFLAQLYGVNPNALREANPQIDFSRIRGGESVNIPLKILPFVPTSPP